MSEQHTNRPPDPSKVQREEEEVVLLEEEDISAGFRSCEKSLIGRIFADRLFFVGTMEIARSRPAGFKVADLEHFKTLEVARKLAKRIGVILNGLKKIRDSLKIGGPSLEQVEVGQRYERMGVKQEALGEWIKADQVGRRIFSEEFKSSGRDANGKENPDQPEKKPLPDWLADSVSNLNLKDNGSWSNRRKGSQAEQKFSPMNMEECIVVGDAETPNKGGRLRIK
ncbi:hypothetical protein PIB30_011173 [Stylosanthes scabra]|uniref:Uncharacterized protein n=1 Tax=Stylosanthes scabra TaxID=79078 RepID=A0ABU6R6L5_9FABA|nr:hypothetical protein [Stylosanthes scabra]